MMIKLYHKHTHTHTHTHTTIFNLKQKIGGGIAVLVIKIKAWLGLVSSCYSWGQLTIWFCFSAKSVALSVVIVLLLFYENVSSEHTIWTKFKTCIMFSFGKNSGKQNIILLEFLNLIFHQWNQWWYYYPNSIHKHWRVLVT